MEDPKQHQEISVAIGDAHTQSTLLTYLPAFIWGFLIVALSVLYQLIAGKGELHAPIGEVLLMSLFASTQSAHSKGGQGGSQFAALLVNWSLMIWSVLGSYSLAHLFGLVNFKFTMGYYISFLVLGSTGVFLLQVLVRQSFFSPVMGIMNSTAENKLLRALIIIMLMLSSLFFVYVFIRAG